MPMIANGAKRLLIELGDLKWSTDASHRMLES